MRAVNLLPKEVQRASAQKPVGPIAAGALLVLISAGLLYKMRSDADQKIVQRQADIAQIVKVPAKVPPNVTDGQRQAAAQEGPRITALDSALKTRIPWDNVLRQISLVVPDDVTLQNLTLKAPIAGDAATAPTSLDPNGVQIVGTSYSQDGVARFLARLDVVGALSDVQLTSSSAADTSTTGGGAATGSSGIVSFTITAAIAAPQVTS
jgi:Tfp pilus assembly protein PilN